VTPRVGIRGEAEASLHEIREEFAVIHERELESERWGKIIQKSGKGWDELGALKCLEMWYQYMYFQKLMLVKTKLLCILAIHTPTCHLCYTLAQNCAGSFFQLEYLRKLTN
jgi:hypothetical protein